MFRLGPITCFRLLLLAGMFCVFMAVVSYAVSFYPVYLDNVLTPEELRDEGKVAFARQILEQIPSPSKFLGLVWFVVGVLIVLVSFRGLVATGWAELRATDQLRNNS